MIDFTPEQQCAIDTIDSNISVSAGAGSGKTRVLVERFVNIISKRKANADGILAITFTRKAAREMRERVRTRINSLIKENTLDSFFWQEQLKLLDRAQICTIDSFCSRLLRENPVEAQVDPAFITTEEFDLSEFYSVETLEYMKKMLRGKDEGLAKLLSEYGKNRLQEMLYSLTENLPVLVEKGDLAKPYTEMLGEDLETLKEQVLLNIAELMDVRETIKGSHREELDAISANLSTIKSAVQNCQTEELSKYLLSLSARNKKDCDLVKETRDLVSKLIMVPIDKRAEILARDWQNFLNGLNKHFGDKKAERKILGFSDVEEKAFQLLLYHEDILDKYRNRYKYVMVDEFQDTNLHQKRLVYLVAGGCSEELKDKRLFVVGDPKQSIYRFRGADVSVFADVRRDIEKTAGINVVLSDNFRSSPGILRVCNEVFEDLMGIDQSSDVVFQPLKANKEEKFKPKLLIVETDKNRKREANKVEALVVAEKIRKMSSEDNTKYADIAILLASINRAQTFASALREAGIPFHIVDGKGFFEKQEIIDIINLLLFLDNGRRDLELAGVLRSPYFGLSDGTITRLFLTRENDNLWQVLVNEHSTLDLSPEQRHQAQRAAEKLKVLQVAARALPLPELFIAIMEELQLIPLLVGQDFGDEKVANIKKLNAMAIDFSMRQGGTLHAFLERAKKMRDAETRIEVSNGQVAQNSVTIMTIHKSKGLEFPIVFLPALHARGKYDTDNIRFLPPIGLGIKVASDDGELVESSVLKKIKQQNKDLEIDEKKRQLYVAMTRAEDQLILSGVTVIDAGKNQSTREEWLDSLKRILVKGNEGKELVDIEMIEADTVKGQGAVLGEEKIMVFADSVYEHIKPLDNPAMNRPVIFSASALQEYDTCPRSYYYHYLAQLPASEDLFCAKEAETCKSVLPANIFGLVIHSTMENIEAYGMNDALQYALDKHVPHYMHQKVRKDAEDMLRTYMDSQLYKEISTLEKRKEEGFCLPLFENGKQEFWFTGSIDCLLTYPDGDLGIIDYKTGRPPIANAEKTAYSSQLAIYVLAAKRLFGKSVRKATLHFLRDNTSWDLPCDISTELEKIKEKCVVISRKKEEQDFAVLPEACEFCNFAYLCPRK